MTAFEDEVRSLETVGGMKIVSRPIRSEIDPCLLVKVVNDKKLVVSLYVVDIVICGNFQLVNWFGKKRSELSRGVLLWYPQLIRHCCRFP